MSVHSEIEHLRTICERGSSADRQLAAYRSALDNGADSHEAINAVKQLLIADTLSPAD